MSSNKGTAESRILASSEIFHQEEQLKQAADNLSKRCFNAMFNRAVQTSGNLQETKLPKKGQKGESIQAKPMLGYRRPGEFFSVQGIDSQQELEAIFNSLILNALRKLAAEATTPEERKLKTEMLGMVLPDFIRALVLDGEFIDHIHADDISNIVDIALDWFLHPELVSLTQIKIGFGGNEEANSRMPAYPISAIRTAERVQETFGRHRNWALLKELYKLTEKSEDIRQALELHTEEFLFVKRQDDASIPTHDSSTYSEFVRDELANCQYVRVQDVTMILLKTFAALGHPLTEKEQVSLAQKYHFTDQTPTLVFFNAAHAAITINSMNREAVLQTREYNKALITAYMSEFHPDLPMPIFQNDRDWSEHDSFTKLMILYAQFVIESHRDEMGGVDDQLESFEANHRQNAKSTHYGMNPAKIYGSLHPYFFGDSPNTESGDQLPFNNVMTPLFQPRHIVGHQGVPEVTFGVYRDVFKRHANLRDLVEWLKRTENLSKTSLSQLAIEVDTKVMEAETPSYGKRLIDYITKKVMPEANIVSTSKNKLLEKAKHLRNEENSEVARQEWLSFCAELQSEDIFAKTGVTADEVSNALIQVQTWQSEARNLNERLFATTDPDQRFEITEQLADSSIPIPVRSTVRIGTSVGKHATYYLKEGDTPLEGFHSADQISLVNYTQRFTAASLNKRTLEGTVPYTQKNVLPALIDSDTSRGWDIFAAALADQLGTIFGEEVFAQWMSEDVDKMANLYRGSVQEELTFQGDKVEKASHVHNFLSQGIQNIAEERIQVILDEAAHQGITLETQGVRHYVWSALVGSWTTEGGKQAITDSEVIVDEIRSTMSDFMVILHDVAQAKGYHGSSEELAKDAGWIALAEREYQKVMRKIFAEDQVNSDAVLFAAVAEI